MSTSKSKLISIQEAAEEVRDGSALGVGGWILNGQPMALVREVARQGKRNLDLIPSPGSIAPDLLIGANCVRSTVCVFISFEQFGLAPQFRRGAESGRLKVCEVDGPGFAGGLKASICGLPYMPIPDMATDVPAANPAHYKSIATAPGDRRLIGVMPIRPDVTFLHAQQADELGNVQYAGPAFFDVMLAQASRKVIVSVDRIVSTDMIRRSNHLTKLPQPFVHADVEAPFGAHPTSSAGLYGTDPQFVASYIKACKHEQDYLAWLDQWVQQPTMHLDYLEKVGSDRLSHIATKGFTYVKA